MRDLRNQQKAEARVARELAGTDTQAQEAEFLDFANKSVASDEFDRLIGLAGEADDSSQSTTDRDADGPARLPDQ